MLIQFSIFPTGGAGSIGGTGGASGTDSASGEVSKVIDIIDNSGLTYKTSSMSTVIEGEWEQIMPVINKCRLKLKENSNRVYMVLTMDDRAGATDRINGKIESIEKKLNREIKK